ncbi:hypothetical protein I7I53_06237 [Histoplasma capsulatum var. duboisii H88]|uniref:Uncharacterized protein n=1 Tax=Ajellomyces capsulatus (strain H88) TaxID=544711 RepID=A0A8A1LAA6_AJEC8|nr:hypothetical protein I7I53_06237 [Histoplasma capsulatum var. duboisii H88]
MTGCSTGSASGIVSSAASSLVRPSSRCIGRLDLCRFCLSFSFTALLIWSNPSTRSRGVFSSPLPIRFLTLFTCLCNWRGLLGVYRTQDDWELLD